MPIAGSWPVCYIFGMILRFYSKLDLLASPGNTLYKMSLMDVPTALGTLQSKLAKYFVDQSESFEPCGYLDMDMDGRFNFKLLTVVPMPVLHHSQPAICWVVHIDLKYDSFKQPSNLPDIIQDLARQIDGLISDGWGVGLNEDFIHLNDVMVLPKCGDLYAVEWSGCWCDGACIIPFVSTGLNEFRPSNSLVFKHGWVESYDYDHIKHYIINDWVGKRTTAVKDAGKHVELLSNTYGISQKFIIAVLTYLKRNHWGATEKLYQRIIDKILTKKKK